MNCTGFNYRDLGSRSLTRLPVTARETVADYDWSTKCLLLHSVPHIAVALCPTHCSRDKHLARPHINKKEIEGDYIPPMPGLPTEK
jgi:hypothetical protein